MIFVKFFTKYHSDDPNAQVYSPPPRVTEHQESGPAELSIHSEEPSDDIEQTTGQDSTNPELNNVDVDLENFNLRAEAWKEGLVNAPAIGGVHLGKVPLKVTRDRDSKIVIVAARSNMLFHSGQVYMPIFKKLTTKTGMRNISDLASFCAMVTNILLPQVLFPTGQAERDKVVRIIKQLSTMGSTIREETSITEGNNSIRMEFFFSSNLSSSQKDWDFPDIIPWEFALISQQSSYFNNLSKCVNEVLGVLKKTFIDNCNQPDYDPLPPEAKAMIILCSELAVTMTEFCPSFSGKAMPLVERHLNNSLLAEEEDEEDEEDIPYADKENTLLSPERIMFHVPESLLVQLPPDIREFTGLFHGLNNCVLMFPKWNPDSGIPRLAIEDMKERCKDYIQIYTNQSTSQIKLANHYLFTMGRILSILWWYQDHKEGEYHQRRSILQLPNFEILAQLDSEKKTAMLVELTKIVSNCYDLEWWWIVKQTSTRRGFVMDGFAGNGPQDFPTTKRMIDRLLERNQHMRNQRNYTGEINSIGKSCDISPKINEISYFRVTIFRRLQ